MPNDRAAIVKELYRRRDQLPEDKCAIVDELARRMNLIEPAPAPAPEKPQGSALSRLGSNFWEEVNPIEGLKGLAHAVTHPRETLRALEENRAALVDRGAEELGKGNYGKAALYGAASLVPLVGPSVAHRGEQAASGDVAGAVGGAAGIATNLLGPKGVRKVKPEVRVRVLPKNRNAVETAAFDYIESKGAAVPAGLRTGHKFWKGLQEVVDTSPAGAVIDYAAARKNTAVLRRTAGELVEAAHPEPVVPETAGAGINRALEAEANALRAAESRAQVQLAEQVYAKPAYPESAGKGVRGTLERRAVSLDKAADQAYAEFYEAAADPANVREVQIGMAVPEAAQAELDALSMSLADTPFRRLNDAAKQTVRDTAASMGIATEPRPVTAKIALPVDMRPIKEALAPLLEDMNSWMEPAKRHASQGYQAVKSIVEGPDFRPAAEAEKGLSGLKTLAREGPYAKAGGEAYAKAMRTTNQGIGANAVSMLQEAIDTAVAAAGGKALAALRKGRLLTAAKYDVAGVLDQLRKEPVQVFGQLTQGRDSSIELLRAVQQKLGAKGRFELAKVGRAYLDDLWSRALETGGFEKARNDWNRLGPETKKILFRNDQRLIQGIDSFFETAGEKAKVVEGMVTAEPVAQFNRAVLPEDANIDRLRALKQIAPGEMRRIGRAWLAKTTTKMMDEGGMGHGAAMWSEWQRLGPETKRILFPDPQHRQDLNNFFLAAKRMGEEFNTSRSGVLLLTASHAGGTVEWFLRDPVRGGFYALLMGAGSGLLHSPAAIRALTNGMTVRPGTAAAAVAFGNILKAAGKDVMPVGDREQ